MPGYYRGGVGVELEFKVFPPNSVVTARGMERYTFRPWGRLGGKAGTTGFTLLNPGTNARRNVGKIDVLYLEPGDRDLHRRARWWRLRRSAWRDQPSGCWRTCSMNWSRVESARDDYGVVIEDGCVDEAATTSLRSDLREQAWR